MVILLDGRFDFFMKALYHKAAKTGSKIRKIPPISLTCILENGSMRLYKHRNGGAFP
jgi:hypothetical protein